MQNAVIQHPKSAELQSPKSLTVLPKLHFASHSSARLQELWEGGEIDRAQVLADIQNTPKHYGEPASKEYIIRAYRMLQATKAQGSRTEAEQAYAQAQFAADLIDEGVTPAELDYAFKVWRKDPDDFMPNQGKIISILAKAGFKKPTKGHGRRYVERLRKLIDPKYTPPKRLEFAGIRTQPKEQNNKPKSKEERRALIDRLNAKYGGRA